MQQCFGRSVEEIDVCLLDSGIKVSVVFADWIAKSEVYLSALLKVVIRTLGLPPRSNLLGIYTRPQILPSQHSHPV